MITDVGIDMDGVMYDFISEFKKYALKRLGRTSLPDAKHWEFYEDWGLSKETFYEWLTDATVSEKVFLTGNPYPNCVAGWQKLRSLNLNIHVLTHRHIEAVGQTSEWLQFHGFIPDSIHFTTHKGVLEAIAVDQAAAIDDYHHYYDLYEEVGVKAFMRTHPWNASYKGRHVADLLDFANAVEIYNKFYAYEDKNFMRFEKSQKIIDDFYSLSASKPRYPLGQLNG
jgi:hypothetical protein